MLLELHPRPPPSLSTSSLGVAHQDHLRRQRRPRQPPREPHGAGSFWFCLPATRNTQHVFAVAGKRGRPLSSLPRDTACPVLAARASQFLTVLAWRACLYHQLGGVAGCKKGLGRSGWWQTPAPRVSRLIVADAGDHRSLIRGFPMGSEPRAGAYQSWRCRWLAAVCLPFSPWRCDAGVAPSHLPTARQVGWSVRCLRVVANLFGTQYWFLTRVTDLQWKPEGQRGKEGALALPQSSRWSRFDRPSARPSIHPPRWRSILRETGTREEKSLCNVFVSD